MHISPNYIVDNQNHKIAVQLDINTYEQIIETLENFALFQTIEQNKEDEALSLQDAKEYYMSLKNPKDT